MTTITVRNSRIAIVQGDITEQSTDAIVNAANSSLMGGGGVDGAIQRKGGPAILKECEEIRKTRWKGGLPVGEAVITTGGNLRARFVIHTVGPIWNGGSANESELLANCYLNSLKLANSNKLHSISFPAVSTGAYGYPIRGAGLLALTTVKNFLLKQDDDATLKEVVFVLFTPRDLEIYNELAKSVMDTA